MKVMPLLENVEFHDKDPYAEPLFVSSDARILRFSLRPGQRVREHMAPHSPVHIVVLKGNGLFAGPDGQEQELGPNSLLTFAAGENHSISAMDEELIFVAFLGGAPDAQS